MRGVRCSVPRRARASNAATGRSSPGVRWRGTGPSRARVWSQNRLGQLTPCWPELAARVGQLANSHKMLEILGFRATWPPSWPTPRALYPPPRHSGGLRDASRRASRSRDPTNRPAPNRLRAGTGILYMRTIRVNGRTAAHRSPEPGRARDRRRGRHVQRRVNSTAPPVKSARTQTRVFARFALDKARGRCVCLIRPGRMRGLQCRRSWRALMPSTMPVTGRRSITPFARNCPRRARTYRR